MITYLAPGTEAKHLIRRQKIITTVTALRSKESIHLGLHSIILGLLVDFLDLVAAACSREPLVGKQTVDLVFHACFLLFCHVRASVLCGQSCLGRGLTSPLLCKLSIGGTRSDISRQFEPREILGPPVDIERKFESQVGRQRHEVILIIGGEDTSDYAVGAQCETLDLITAFDDVVLWEEAGHLKKADQIEYNYSPSVDVQIER